MKCKYVIDRAPGGEALIGGVGRVDDAQSVAGRERRRGGGGRRLVGGAGDTVGGPVGIGVGVGICASDRRTGERGHGVPGHLGCRRGRHLGVQVPPGRQDAHVSQLVPDAVHPLVHGRSRVAGEPDGHAGLEVDHEAPLPVRRHQAGRQVLADGQRVHQVRGATGRHLRRLRPQLQERVGVVVHAEHRPEPVGAHQLGEGPGPPLVVGQAAEEAVLVDLPDEEGDPRGPERVEGGDEARGRGAVGVDQRRRGRAPHQAGEQGWGRRRKVRDWRGMRLRRGRRGRQRRLRIGRAAAATAPPARRPLRGGRCRRRRWKLRGRRAVHLSDVVVVVVVVPAARVLVSFSRLFSVVFVTHGRNVTERLRTLKRMSEDPVILTHRDNKYLKKNSY